MGVDPGLVTTGYGVVEVTGRKLTLIKGGAIAVVAAGEPLERRLQGLHEGLAQAIKAYQPEAIALEQLYSHYKHPRTAILMGHARGIICLAAAQAGLAVFHYGATQVKGGITGSGHASKEQVQRAVQMMLELSEPPSPSDVADALALALYHCLHAEHRLALGPGRNV
ncbi:MAG: crossover junction endodeoxyribonuclease RuvC [Chloroflexi bacterium]|nr:crossover junction endodeoxyribonuclease RuvC [Chloroflexota bacterium]